MENTNFISPTRQLAYFNAAFSQYYALVVSIYEDEFVAQDPYAFTVTVTGGSNEAVKVDLPADFYKMRGLDKDNNGDFFPIRKFEFLNRNRDHVNRPIWGFYPPVRYRLWGNQFLFDDSSNAAGDYRLWYIPLPQVFTDAANDIVTFANQYREDYVVAEFARRCLIKEESDTRAIDAEIGRLQDQIESFDRDRDAGEPEQITDVNIYEDQALNLTGFDVF
jgi:hypothetical protein